MSIENEESKNPDAPRSPGVTDRDISLEEITANTTEETETVRKPIIIDAKTETVRKPIIIDAETESSD